MAREQAIVGKGAERKFRDVLEACNIRYEYEPTIFWFKDKKTVAHAKEKQGCCAFRPDIYFPDQDLYVELTVATNKTSLWRKKRKLRMMREHYPHIQVVIWTAADMIAFARGKGFDLEFC